MFLNPKYANAEPNPITFKLKSLAKHMRIYGPLLGFLI
jgi:hypothetical protein